MNSKQLKQLRSKAHHLNPVTIVGQKGLGEPIFKEVTRNLDDHGLIKVRLQEDDREERKAMADEIANQCQAHIAQMIGKNFVLYKEKED